MCENMMALFTNKERNIVREYLEAYREYVTTIRLIEALYGEPVSVYKTYVKAMKASVDELYDLLPKDVKDYGLVPTI